MFRLRKRRHAVQLRVTMIGWLFFAMSLLLGIAAANSHMPMVFVFFGTMLFSVAVSAIFSWWMLRGLGVHREMPGRIWQNETLYFGYFLRNRHHRSSCLGLSLREIRPEGIHDARGYCLHIPPQSAFRSGSRMTAERRGRVRLQGIRLSTNFPFGLVNAIRTIDQPDALIVWPAKGRLKTELLQRGAAMTSSLPPSRSQGGQDEFFGLREYRMGDNIRWIHWRRSAGRTQPVVREMTRPLPDALYLLVDVRLRSDDAEARARREQMLRFSATIIDHAFRRGYQVGMAIAHGVEPRIFAPAGSVDARSLLLDALAEVTEEPPAPADRIAAAVPPAYLRNAQVQVLSDLDEPLSATALGQVATACRDIQHIRTDDLPELFEDPVSQNSGGRF